ncbi:MAG: kelch repeat-containing protein [Candidatus Limnocylindrales bacterium]|jgi:hypothetical protein
MNDWPADPRLDEGLRRLVDAELMSARADAAGLSGSRGVRRHREDRAVAGLGLLAVIAIVAALAVRGNTTGGWSAGGPGASESPSAHVVVTAGASAPESAAPESAAPSPAPTPTALPGTPGTFTPTGSMTTSDNGTATLLLDGRVLIVGNAATSPEIYDPKTGRFTSTGPAVRDIGMASATRLADGRVLFVGGSDGTNSIAAAQVYDPATGKFSVTGSLSTSRMGHTATLLPDGRVLIAGGSTFGNTGMVQAETMAYRPGAVGHGGGPVAMTGPAMLASAEIYDPKTGKFTATGSMTTGRDAASATLLTNGRVLIVGGGNEGSAAVRSAELYDPKTGKFSRTGAMLTAGYGFTSTLLPDGRVLISAGNDGNGPIYSLEIYDPKTGKFSAAGTVGPKRGFYTSTLLADGRVLLSGGYDTTAAKSAGYLATCELYDPATGKLSPTGSMAAGRLGHSATTLLDGRVLVAGGVGDPGNLASAELYQP